MQEITPWSIYDHNFKQFNNSTYKQKQKQKQKQKHISKTIDSINGISKLSSVQLYNPQKNYIDDNNKFKLKYNHHLIKENDNQNKFYQINTLSKQKISAEKIHLEETLHQIIILKIIRQQLCKQNRLQNQNNNIGKNILQFEDSISSEKFQFPKISKSFLLTPQPSQKYKQMSEYIRKMKYPNPSSNISGSQFSDEKLIQKSIQIYRNNKRHKKLSSLLLYSNKNHII